jgi:hypothetical protein
LTISLNLNPHGISKTIEGWESRGAEIQYVIKIEEYINELFIKYKKTNSADEAEKITLSRIISV